MLALALGAIGSAGCGVEADGGASEADSQALRSGDGNAQAGLDAWQNVYTRWEFGEIQIPNDRFGNAAVGNTVLMPIPDTPGDGTPGSVAVTLNDRESFFLQLFALFGTHYTDGTPPDPFEPISIFKTLEINFSVDGVTLIDGDNVLRQFSKFRFHPPVPVDFAPIDSIIWFEGVGVLHKPLRPGAHTLKLDVRTTEPAFGGFIEFHNTWNIEVRRR